MHNFLSCNMQAAIVLLYNNDSIILNIGCYYLYFFDRSNVGRELLINFTGVLI